MNQFYEKINFKLSEQINFESLKGDLHHQYAGDTYLKYSYVNNRLKSYAKTLFSKFTDIAPCVVRYVEVLGDTVIEPHKDYGVACAINYYFATAGATTVWFNEKPNATPTISNSEKSHVYNHLDLVIADHFIAQDNECYLLNTSQIHSVIKCDQRPRQFIQIQYNIEYDLIKKLIRGD